MIRVVARGLSAREQFGLDLLIDLSCCLRLAEGATIEGAVDVDVADVAPPRARTAVDEIRSFAPGVSDGRVSVLRSVLAAVCDVAGAVAEQHTEAADRHGRVPSSANALVTEGIERSPVVSSAARVLRAAVVAAAGTLPTRFLAPWPAGYRWAAALTHDVDVVRWWPLFTALRVTELARKGRWAEVAAVGAAAAAGAIGSPVRRALRHILDVERAAGVRSTWFMLCGDPTPATFSRGDLTYQGTGAAARGIVADVLAAGHEVGLHGSFATFERPEAFLAQRSSLGTIAPIPRGVRQHFLRARPPATQRAMRDAGFDYDATLGFSDRNGFRLGTADVLPLWDDAAGAPVAGLDVAPLAWMDRALSKYRGVEDPRAWVDDALELAARCRAVDGLWVGLWHPNFSTSLGYPGAARQYERLVAELTSGRPWTASLGEITRWRRARRSVRVARATNGGVACVSASTSSEWPIAIEDAEGRALGVLEMELRAL